MTSRCASYIPRCIPFGSAAVCYGRVLALDHQDSLAVRGLQRNREASNLRRESQIRRSFDTALDAFITGDLIKADAAFSQVLRDSPRDDEARSMLRRVRGLAAHRATQLLKEARVLIARGEFDPASERVNAVALLNPETKGLKDVELALTSLKERNELMREQASARITLEPDEVPTAPKTQPKRQKRDQSPKPKNPTAPEPESDAEMTFADRRRVEHLATMGDLAGASDRIDEAIRYWELALNLDPDHNRSRENLKENYILNGLDAFAAGDFDDAIRLWEKALRVDPADERTLGYLDRARQYQARAKEILSESNPLDPTQSETVSPDYEAR